MENKHEYTLIICAGIFGTDETLLSIKLNNRFSFKRMSLIPIKDNLDAIFQVDAMGLRREYETARIDDSLDIICAYYSETVYSETVILEDKDAKDYFNLVCDKALVDLDNSIRTIRLLVECSLHFKKMSVQMASKTFKFGTTNMTYSFKAIIPISEALDTKIMQCFHCARKDINQLNKYLSSMQFPLSNQIVNSCHAYFDLSYHQLNHVSITLLITCLEMLYLHSEQGKKEKLAKRCAYFLYNHKSKRLKCFKRLQDLYKKRSELYITETQLI